jgi:hypothetical protein
MNMNWTWLIIGIWALFIGPFGIIFYKSIGRAVYHWQRSEVRFGPSLPEWGMHWGQFQSEKQASIWILIGSIADIIFGGVAIFLAFQ